MTYVNPSENVIDSRDVIEQISELKALRDDPDNDDWDESQLEELLALQSFADDGETNAADWEYGATLIREDYFVDYVKELIPELGYLSDEIPDWIVIDWEETADNVRADYNEIEFDGVTYLARA